MEKQKVALITGGTSGIGAEFARQLAAQGYDIVITGRRIEKLKEVCSEIRSKYGVKANEVVIELSDPAQLLELEKWIASESNLEVLINNAGYGTDNAFLKNSADDCEKMIRVHDTATVRLSHAASKVMVNNRKGYIVNTSSVAAFLVSGGDILYYSTKAFLNSFTESLHVSLKPFGVRAMAVCPGFTVSEFHSRLGMDTEKLHKQAYFMTSEKVVSKSLRALKRRKVIFVPGFVNKFLVFFLKIIPRRFLYAIMTVRAKNELKNGD